MRAYLKVFPALILSLFLVGCWGNPTPPVTPPPVPKVEAVSPKVEQIGQKLDETIKINKDLEDQLNKQKKIVTEQKIAIADAIAKAEKMKDKITANEILKEIDAIDLINDLKSVEARNLFLENQNTTLVSTNKTQEKELQNLRLKATEALEKAKAKEKEADDLRNNTIILTDSLSKANSQIEGLKKDLTKEKVKAATAGVYRNWIIGITSIFVLWTIAKNVLMIYFPMLKFRI